MPQMKIQRLQYLLAKLCGKFIISSDVWKHACCSS